MVTKANSKGSSLVGKQVTLTVPAGSTVGATACVDSAGVLTLRSLVVKRPAPGAADDHDDDQHHHDLEHRERAAPAPQVAPLIQPLGTAEGCPDRGRPSRFLPGRAIVRPSPGGLRRVLLALGQPVQLTFRVAPTFRLFARIKPSKGGCTT